MPIVLPSSNFANVARPEFVVGDDVLALNHLTYLKFLQIARYTRLPLLLLGSFLLWRIASVQGMSNRILVVWFWSFSPMILGHGYIVSADTLSGVAMCLIVYLSVPLWNDRNVKNFAYSGVAWGIAIGTKFTFAPLYVAYPLIIELTCFLSRKLYSRCKRVPNDNSKILAKQFDRSSALKWILHASIACIVLNCLYLFDGTGTRLDEHDFNSKLFMPFGSHGESIDTPSVWPAQSLPGCLRRFHNLF